MKKTQTTYLLRTIRKNIVSFLAVAMMVATGVSIYLGDQSSALAILEHTDRYFAENRLQSLEVSNPYGITEEDIEAIAGWDGVDAVEGGFSSIVLLDTGSTTGKTLIQAHAMLDTMNIPVILEGRLPTAENETAVEQILAEKEGVGVGDRITVEHDGQLKSDSFTVTAIINEPAFCCARAKDARGRSDKGIGSAYYYISLPKAAFDSDYFNHCYTTAYIKNDSLDQYYYFSDAYKEQEAAFRDSIAALGEQRAQLRYEAAKAEAQEALADAEKELLRQEKNLSDAKTMLTYTFDQIGLSTDFDQAKEQLQTFGRLKEPMLQILAEVEKGEAALEEAWEDFYQAEQDAAEMPFYNWVVSIRNDIGDVRSVDIIVEGLYGLSYSMAIIFVIVSVTVCYAAISRMISESRTQIGMQKALGFTSRQILRHYMSYSIICGIWGILSGWIVSLISVQTLNLLIYKRVFLLGTIPHSFSWPHAILVSLFFMAIFIVSAYAACIREIRLPATDLLRGTVPQRNRNFWFENQKAFQKLRLYTKTMIKNAFDDTSRMMTTVMGVAGCTTLLVISFTLLLAMEESSVIHFDQYFLYQNRLVVDSEQADYAEFENILDAENISYTRIQDKLKFCREEGGNWSGAHVVAVSNAQELKDYMVLEDVKTREILDVPEDGVLVSVRFADNLGLKKGAKVEIMDAAGNPKTATVAGIIEHYLSYNLMVTSDQYYETVMEEEADACVFLLKGNIDGLYNKVKDADGFISLRDNSEYSGLGDVMDMVVLVCFAFAALMAVLVMLNQNVMHINQKSKELSVMRINGFTLKETKAFVSRDNFVLTATGILLGWVIGMGLGYLVLSVLEVGLSRYVRTPSIKACLMATAICASFAFLMNRIAVRRIHRLNLSNINAN